VECGGIVIGVPDEICGDEVVFPLHFSEAYGRPVFRLASSWLEVEEQDDAFENCLVIPSIASMGVVENNAGKSLRMTTISALNTLSEMYSSG
jgi:hypothetical protein